MPCSTNFAVPAIEGAFPSVDVATERAVDTYRNHWVLEKSEFFNQRAEAARVVREDSIESRQAV